MYDPTFIEFNCEFGALVALLQKRGFRREQAMDAASEAMACAYQRWSRIDRSMRGWLRTAAYHIACRQAQRAREEPFRAVAGGWGVSTHYDVDVMEIIQEHNRLLRLLQLLPAQQRRVMERHLAGFNTKEISDQLNMLPATVRSNIRYGRDKFRHLATTDDQDLHLWSGQRLWEAFQSGDPLPAIPRPVILRAWKIAKFLKVPPERGREVKPLGSNELQHGRYGSPFSACPWALDALAELGKTTKQMMVVVDSDGVVLWRGGDRKILGLADELTFVEGAHWDIEHAGANGIALALATKQTVMVSRWEHYVRAQHGLSCIAAPVRSPQDGRALCVLNLTGTEPTIHPAIRRQVDTLAMRLHMQLHLMHTQEYRGGRRTRAQTSDNHGQQKDTNGTR